MDLIGHRIEGCAEVRQFVIRFVKPGRHPIRKVAGTDALRSRLETLNRACDKAPREEKPDSEKRDRQGGDRCQRDQHLSAQR